MEIWSEIRREVLASALSKRAAIAKYGIARPDPFSVLLSAMRKRVQTSGSRSRR